LNEGVQLKRNSGADCPVALLVDCTDQLVKPRGPTGVQFARSLNGSLNKVPGFNSVLNVQTGPETPQVSFLQTTFQP
jgi:hypothetical protein